MNSFSKRMFLFSLAIGIALSFILIEPFTMSFHNHGIAAAQMEKVDLEFDQLVPPTNPILDRNISVLVFHLDIQGSKRDVIRLKQDLEEFFADDMRGLPEKTFSTQKQPGLFWEQGNLKPSMYAAFIDNAPADVDIKTVAHVFVRGRLVGFDRQVKNLYCHAFKPPKYTGKEGKDVGTFQLDVTVRKASTNSVLFSTKTTFTRFVEIRIGPNESLPTRKDNTEKLLEISRKKGAQVIADMFSPHFVRRKFTFYRDEYSAEGLQLLENGTKQEAVDSWNEATRKSNQAISAQFNLALASLLTGDIAGARERLMSVEKYLCLSEVFFHAVKLYRNREREMATLSSMGYAVK
ncbi:MAG TPA: hypothetical protein PK961_06640 [bacterium]|nr:hypothetical protein [bacterium]